MIFRPFAVGSNYPNVAGSNSNSNQGVERLYLRRWICAGFADQRLLIETGNMLIMTYANARASGDGSLISRYVRQESTFCLIRPDELGQYNLLASWADYLIASTLFIHDQ